MIKYYILFDSHNDGLSFEKALKNNNLKYTIVPTPRILSKCCGISIMLKEEVVNKVKDLVNKSKIKYEGLYKVNKETKEYERVF
ncbi:DUF3343 domain-containing protein [Tepidibacter formicigenes]|jgi:hypothetical protein|uniref:Putative Se/S carrier protein-like domain-containing protein n=1 Tax=Tepidibacter formicigenes DSM 15518 TaxID=1123349 RepID=A0A1M6P486_9FIRM|nr:DUF3343 domain-containing protein [Tepidibacter formicigenes]SHK02712.1 Protein of unknown function [Tepidibacter formicigenes DSM 15518]